MPLNENEKAATYIGWKPGQPSDCRFDDSDRYCRNGTEHCYIDHAIATKAAPDMSRPDNYMRALDREMCELSRDYDGWQLDLARLKAPAIWYSTAGEAIIKALAALYDAEHPQPDRGPV